MCYNEAMKEKYFENPEQTRTALKILIKKREASLEYALENRKHKGDKALPPDEFAVFEAEMALKDAKRRLEQFETELTLLNASPEMGE